MPRVWLQIIVYCSMSISIDQYLTGYIYAGICTCTVAASTGVPDATHNSPFFIQRTPKLSNQVHLWAPNSTQCTQLCQTVTQLYTHVWGITPDTSKTQFAPNNS